MSGVYQARVNQKIYFARLHLEALQEVLKGSGWSKHVQIESYNESVLFHLACGYGAFLRELAEHYRLDVESVNQLDDLLAASEKSGLETPELATLRQLQQDQSSWLNQLQHAYQACWMASEKAAQPSATTSLSEIHVVQVNPDHAEDGAVVEQLQSWLDQLRSLVESLREGMLEW